jgi:chloramphenicol-sensitive protein RarD
MNDIKKGLPYSLLAHFVWGILPLYWALFGHLDSLELLFYRVALTSITLLALVHIIKKPLYLKYLGNKETLLKLFATGFLISINWGVFVYAVSSKQVIQSSLGYYIGPIFSVLFGLLFLKETLKPTQIVAFLIVLIGLVIMLINNPASWIAFTLAVSFSLYGFLKKSFQLDSFNALLLESTIAIPLIGAFLFVFSPDTAFNIGHSTPFHYLALSFAGILTLIPLILFAEGAKLLPLYLVGSIQYLTPTMFLLIGIFVNNESFTLIDGIVFILIWIGLGLNFYALLKGKKLS